MDSRERVWRAVEFEGPDRVPFEWYEYGVGVLDLKRTDIAGVGFKPLQGSWSEAGNEIRYVDEWGCIWVSYKSLPTIGRPIVHPLQNWDNINNYKFPELSLEKRFEGVDKEVKRLRNLGKYIVGWLGAGIWARTRFLRGFREALADLYMHRDRIYKLLEFLTEFKIGLIRGYSELDIDCVAFTDDWGTQSRLFINPKIWVEVFRPYYMRIFKEAKKRGLHTYIHSCGNIYDIIGYWVKDGLNIIQMDAPHQVGLERLSKYAGKICFNCCIDIQKILVRGVESEIYEEAKKMIELLGCEDGGFIARQYPQLAHIKVKPEVNEIAYKAFLKFGKIRANFGRLSLNVGQS